MNAVQKRIIDMAAGTAPKCHYCGQFSDPEERFCTHCGQKNSTFDTKYEAEIEDTDCKTGHAGLKDAVETGGLACVERPFCEDCGFCGLPVTWREHERPLNKATSFELVKDNKQVAFVYLWLADKSLLDPNRMTLNREDENLSFVELYEHIEKAPNLPDDVRELLMASKNRWDVGSDKGRIILLKQ